MRDVNMLMAGVGGQGVILASDTLGEIGMNNGYDVKKSDSIGMAQRGGSVVSNIRLGKHVFAPIIKKGEAHFLLGFEQLEAARWASYLEQDGVAIVADATIIPVSVIGGTTPYPGQDDVRGILSGYTKEIYSVPAVKICLEVGNPRALNMVMLGSLSVFLELNTEAWTENIRRRVPSRFVESSLEAFTRGAAEIKEMRRVKGTLP
jgi:indolepyruvate ferredoxin oxidoreductase beta subunit